MKKSDEFGWRIQETISPHTGEVRRTYFFRGRKSYRIPWDSHIAKQLAGWSLIEKDLRNIAEWNQLLIELIEEACGEGFNPNRSMRKAGTSAQAATMKALTVSILAFYGKLFTTAKGRRVVLQKTSVHEEFSELHDKLMEMRHSYVAHAGEEGHEEAVIAVALDSNEARWTPHRVYTELHQINNFVPAELQKLAKLVDRLQGDAKNKLEKLHQKLDSEIMKEGASLYDRVRKAKRRKS